MTELEVDLILNSTPEDPAFDNPMRILLVADGYVWMIPVAVGKNRGYARGPLRFLEDLVRSWVKQGRLHLSEFTPPAHWAMPDAELNRLYSGDVDVRCPAIIRRDDSWSTIEPYVRAYEVAEAIQSMSYRTWIPERCSELSTNERRYWPPQLYHSLHLYWAAGKTRQVLLGNTVYCGARGAVREQTKKLGRTNAEMAGRDTCARSEDPDLSGFVMTPEAAARIQFGWQYFNLDRSVAQRYLETMGTFWRESVEMVNGLPTAILLPCHLRPTKRQFQYWGERADRNRSATETSAAECDTPQAPRPLPSYANRNILKIGQIVWADSSPGDVELTSISSRLIHVGTATYLELIDARSEVICGVYIGFERPSARIALLAAAHAAMSKTDWCARFGFPGITDDQIPRIRSDRILTDNGEFRNALSMEVSLDAWEGSITYAPAGMPEAKGTVEGDHHARHSETDHRLAGTTHGRRREYGEPHPIVEAAWNMYEYTHLHIARILRHNTGVPAPHLLTGEMRQDLTVAATRMQIFLWLKKHGYFNGAPPSPDLIRARMLPTFDATLTSRGIFLHRPDRGRKKEFLLGCHFVGDYLARSGMLANAQNHVLPVRINMDPNDLTVAWLPTRDGLQRLDNLHRNDLLVARGSIEEVCVIQDSDARVQLKERTEQDQRDSDFISARENTNRSAIEQRDKERAAVKLGLLPQPAASLNNDSPHVRRQAEISRLEEQGMASPIDTEPLDTAPVATRPQTADPAAENTQKENIRAPSINDDVRAALLAYKQRKVTP